MPPEQYAHEISQQSDNVNALGAAIVAGKNIPPVGVAVASLGGMQLQEWVYILTIIWLVAQIVGWCIDRYKKHIKARSDA